MALQQYSSQETYLMDPKAFSLSFTFLFKDVNFESESEYTEYINNLFCEIIRYC